MLNFLGREEIMCKKEKKGKDCITVYIIPNTAILDGYFFKLKHQSKRDLVL